MEENSSKATEVLDNMVRWERSSNHLVLKGADGRNVIKNFKNDGRLNQQISTNSTGEQPERIAEFGKNDNITTDTSIITREGLKFEWVRNFAPNGVDVISEAFILNSKKVSLEKSVNNEGKAARIFSEEDSLLFERTYLQDGKIRDELRRDVHPFRISGKTLQRVVVSKSGKILEDASYREDETIEWKKFHREDGTLERHEFYNPQGITNRIAYFSENGRTLTKEQINKESGKQDSVVEYVNYKAVSNKTQQIS